MLYPAGMLNSLQEIIVCVLRIVMKKLKPVLFFGYVETDVVGNLAWYSPGPGTSLTTILNLGELPNPFRELALFKLLNSVLSINFREF